MAVTVDPWTRCGHVPVRTEGTLATRRGTTRMCFRRSAACSGTGHHAAQRASAGVLPLRGGRQDHHLLYVEDAKTTT